MACNICGTTMVELGRTPMLQRYEGVFQRCMACGFIQVSDPGWLEEAYASAITRSDVGVVDRNLQFVKTARMVIDVFFEGKGHFLDYGGGPGLFTRLMRDAGYDFFWQDSHCQNLYAQGFAADIDSAEHYDLLTAVEVFEHLTDPLAAMKEMTRLADNLLVMTQLVPDPPPLPGEWWYYGPEHGQHVSFFSQKSLELLAQKYRLHFATNGRSLHLFSTRPISSFAFTFFTWSPIATLSSLLLRRRSLLADDFINSQVPGKE